MQFNSLEFLYGFFPLFLAVYYMVSQGLRPMILFAGSMVFYVLASGGNYWWAAILLGCTFISYLSGRILDKWKNAWILAFFLMIFGGVLVFFKLYHSGRHLPAGMSFYLFQITAYLIDVYRGKVAGEKNVIRYANQIVMFPKLLSGPMVNPRELSSQMRKRPTRESVRSGLQLLILGLALKVVVANRLGGIWAQANVMGFASISSVYAWFALVSWAMQLYFDFYGYSLMAMGIGRMVGFYLPENFIDPYASKSVSEFYRRWHASLGAWFREYLYIPLGGNRKGIFRTLVNLVVVWLFTGLWHGVGGNYLLWAGILCFFVILERLWLRKFLERSHVLCHVYVVFVILLSWVPFAVGDWHQMLIFFGKLFGQVGGTINTMDFMPLISMYSGILLLGAFLATPIPRRIWTRIKESTLADVLLFALFWVVVYFISTAAQDPFLYFQY